MNLIVYHKGISKRVEMRWGAPYELISIGVIVSDLRVYQLCIVPHIDRIIRPVTQMQQRLHVEAGIDAVI
jgi:hypothetical protein